jgi:antitoxin ParD1/3/4
VPFNAIIWQRMAIMASMNISLSAQMKEWVESKIAGGAYNNSSEYIRDLIRRDQEIAAHNASVIAALEAGRNSGYSELNFDKILERARIKAKSLK